MRLYFLRHTDASHESNTPDAERSLSPKGAAQAETIAAFLSRLDLQLNRTLSSPYLRAKQTAIRVCSLLNAPAPEYSSCLTPETEPVELFEELRHFSRDSRILLVSHEPFLSTCIGNLILFNSFPKIIMGKGALACVEIGGQAQSGAGVLLWLMQYDQIAALTHPIA
ncbi:MAG: phosphohistidine phosphatase SixA [Ignavibacteriales bacterium]|nr:phosphohistidine phosphatase SixA [Ignavibacteriales bacterium]